MFQFRLSRRPRTMQTDDAEHDRLTSQNERFAPSTESNTEENRIPDHEDFEQKYREAQQEGSVLKQKLKDYTKHCEALTCALEAKEEDLKDLRDTAEKLTEQARDTNIARIHAEERFRRQTENLTKTTAELNVASQEIRDFALKQMKLQKWTEQSDDDEIRQTMGTLCQQLEAWAKRHFLRSVLGREFYWYSGDVSRRIFEVYLSRFLVGIVDEDFEGQAVSQTLQSLDRKVEDICPPNIKHLWRSATSKAAFSINTESLKTSCSRLVEHFESEWGGYSPTDQQKRTSQLTSLLWKFVDFKAKLELQADGYAFAMMAPQTTFNEEEMISFNGEFGPNTVVDYTISPALIKIPADGCQTCLFKARVKTVQVLQPSISPEVDYMVRMNTDWDGAEETENEEHLMETW